MAAAARRRPGRVWSVPMKTATSCRPSKTLTSVDFTATTPQCQQAIHSYATASGIYFHCGGDGEDMHANSYGGVMAVRTARSRWRGRRQVTRPQLRPIRRQQPSMVPWVKKVTSCGPTIGSSSCPPSGSGDISTPAAIRVLLLGQGSWM